MSKALTIVAVAGWLVSGFLVTWVALHRCRLTLPTLPVQTNTAPQHDGSETALTALWTDSLGLAKELSTLGIQEANKLAHKSLDHMLSQSFGMTHRELQTSGGRFEGHVAQAAYPNRSRCLLTLGREYKLKTIAELGFNAGHSVATWLLNSPDAAVLSFDICTHPYSAAAAGMILNMFGPDRHRLICGNSVQAIPTFIHQQHQLIDQFDLVHVDGAHYGDIPKRDVENMVIMAKEGGILLMDDCRWPPVWRTWRRFMDGGVHNVTTYLRVRGKDGKVGMREYTASFSLTDMNLVCGRDPAVPALLEQCVAKIHFHSRGLGEKWVWPKRGGVPPLGRRGYELKDGEEPPEADQQEEMMKAMP
eukprot:TRINITY_DN62344_c0_g1_i1.p1 TRINITY_DN62344_c0_g1~~TRINITY_DN62344_c0_g1_i1.p1  ORF type:complete len:361 (-),score=8.62 TRINITY_DN62344_c0_g1_i1:8-1090(-)